MKKWIAGLKDVRLVYAAVVIGALLIIFPDHFKGIAPHALGAALMIYAVINFVVLRQYPDIGKHLGMKDINPGRSFVLFVLGAAILAQHSDAIGPIGSIWAMLSLYGAGVEINEMAQENKVHAFNVITVLISTALAILLLFDPFEHFSVHVRVLGLEMIVSVFQRRHGVSEEEKG